MLFNWKKNMITVGLFISIDDWTPTIREYQIMFYFLSTKWNWKLHFPQTELKIGSNHQERYSGTQLLTQLCGHLEKAKWAEMCRTHRLKHLLCFWRLVWSLSLRMKVKVDDVIPQRLQGIVVGKKWGCHDCRAVTVRCSHEIRVCTWIYSYIEFYISKTQLSATGKVFCAFRWHHSCCGGFPVGCW